MLLLSLHKDRVQVFCLIHKKQELLSHLSQRQPQELRAHPYNYSKSWCPISFCFFQRAPYQCHDPAFSCFRLFYTSQPGPWHQHLPESFQQV